MQTRIRELRKLRSLTLKQLADKVGTTAQTIQRLETASMTVSTSWLERIAIALHVTPAELLTLAGPRDIPFIGRVGQSGTVYRNGNESGTFNLDIPTQDPIAVRLDQTTGRFEMGSIIIASKLREADRLSVNGVDCLVGLTSTVVLLRRVFQTTDGAFMFAPLDAGAGAEFELPFDWIARIVMSIRYY